MITEVEEIAASKHGVHSTLGSFSVNAKGYPRLNKRPRRYLHRVVFEAVAGRPVLPGFHIHHMNGKLCWCPWQLVEVPAALNPSPQPIRHPWTGQFISAEEYERLLGVKHWLAEAQPPR